MFSFLEARLSIIYILTDFHYLSLFWRLLRKCLLFTQKMSKCHFVPDSLLYTPEEPDLPVGEHDVLALHGGQLQPQVRHLRLHLPLLLPVLHLVCLDVEQDLLLAQLAEKISKLMFYLAVKHNFRFFLNVK